MAKRPDNIVTWAFMVILCIPFAIIWLLKLCVKGVVLLCTLFTKPVPKASSLQMKHSPMYKDDAGSADYLSKTSAVAEKSKGYSSSDSKSRSPVQKGKRMSLYDALRIPGDPDAEFGGCFVYVNVDDTESMKSTPSVQGIHDDVFDEKDEYNENYEDYEDADEDFDEELDDGFESVETDDESGSHFGVGGWFLGHNDDGNADDNDYSWETHCEYCGELLEDCTCDHKHESHQAISLGHCGCDEEDDDDERGLLDFDKFR